MADERNESRIRRMDLNLYLGLPRSPRHHNLVDLGSDLALGSLPLSSDMSSVVELSAVDSHAPYSPTRATYNPDVPSGDLVHLADINSGQEFTPYEPFGPPGTPILPMELELEGPDGLYDPVPALPTVQENDELHMEAYDPMSPSVMADRASPRAGHLRMPYMPTTIGPSLDEVDSGMYQLLPASVGEFLSREDGSSSRQDLRSPEFRFRRLIEVNNRLRRRRYLMSPPGDGERSGSDHPSSPTAEQLVHDIMSSQRELGTYGKRESPAKNVAAEVPDEETKEKIKGAANFECNICLDMAQEPVVTSCGHLFCWPCLFQWLHLHSDHQECPVCKGEVIESNIIPIYGRGSSESSDEKKLGKSEESRLKIPPRPRGNRFESFRQQHRPISRRLGEGIANSWRRLMDQQRIRSRNSPDPTLVGIFDGGYRTPLTRMRARRMQREEGIPESPPITEEIGLPRDSIATPQTSSSNLLFRDGGLWRGFSLHGLSSSERLAAMAADIGTVVGRFGSTSNQFAATTSSVNPPVPEPPVSRAPAPSSSAADQASASSTMAVIQGDVAATDASVEPNSAGSSRSYRRRGRSSAAGSLDVDGGALHVRKRRRP